MLKTIFLQNFTAQEGGRLQGHKERILMKVQKGRNNSGIYSELCLSRLSAELFDYSQKGEEQVFMMIINILN